MKSRKDSPPPVGLPRNFSLPGYRAKISRAGGLNIPIMRNEAGATPFRSSKEVNEDHEFVRRMAKINKGSREKPRPSAEEESDEKSSSQTTEYDE